MEYFTYNGKNMVDAIRAMKVETPAVYSYCFYVDEYETAFLDIIKCGANYEEESVLRIVGDNAVNTLATINYFEQNMNERQLNVFLSSFDTEE